MGLAPVTSRTGDGKGVFSVKTARILCLLIVLAAGPCVAADSAGPGAWTRCVGVFESIADAYHRVRGRSPEDVRELRDQSRSRWEARREAFVDYWRHVYHTRGARLILRPSDPQAPERRFSGLFTQVVPPAEKRWFRHFRLLNPVWWMQAPVRAASHYLSGTPFELTPFGMLYHSFLRRPVGWASERYLGERREPSNLVRLPLGFGVAWILFGLFDDWFDKKLKEKIDRSVQEHGEEYDHLVEYDRRFAWVRSLAQPDPGTGKARLTREQARDRAARVLAAHNIYTEYLAGDGQSDPPERRRERMLAFMQILAPHLTEIVDQGVSEREGYLVPPDRVGPVPQARIDELLEVQNEVFLRYRLVRAHVYGDAEALAEIARTPAARERLGEILADPYSRFLQDVHGRGDLTREELLQELQVDIDWRGRLATCEVLGITPLSEGSANEAVTIMDVRRGAVRAIAERAKARDRAQKDGTIRP